MKIGIVGATGAVGRQMIQCLEERNIEVDELRLFASERSKGKYLSFNDKQIVLDVVKEHAFDGLDYVLGAVSNALSQKYRPMIEKAGAIYIDNSSAFRQEEGVPLVVPQINGKDALQNHGTIANPNCSTAITLMAIAPIAKLSKIKSIQACTYQAVSGAGNQGMEELQQQIDALQNDMPIQINVFGEQIAYNVIADIGTTLDNGYTTEEMKMQNEGRKILHQPDLKATCTCVRVPVYRSHSIALTVITEHKLDLEEIEASMQQFPGVIYNKDELPTPLKTSDQDSVYVGRLRRDLVNDNGIVLWCCGDQIRKGAASNAVEILEYLLQHA